jgi:serine/tyrosine/threonine adenylyltransferase
MSLHPEDLKWVNRFSGLHDHTLQALGVSLGTELRGQSMSGLHWGAHSQGAAQALGWPADWWQQATPGTASALEVFGGNEVWPGMRPMASVYSGHQFGQWAGQLGDGRALLLGEVQTPTGSLEVQLKGAGMTPYSRRADGRAVLRSSIREFLCSEAMHALGIPTSRALCLTASPLLVYRETAESAAVVTRLAPSFIRFGHFEHFAHHQASGYLPALAALVDGVVDHHLPDLQHLPGAATCPERVVGLLRHAALSTAAMIAQWQAVGFCHGVMNTDNMSILGLTIDYGPFGFLDGFDPNHICNHSDAAGRYRWRYQPDIGFWNVGALAQALAALVPDAATDRSEGQLMILGALKAYEPHFEQQMLMRWRAKLGLLTEQADDQALLDDWLKLMAAQRADFSITWRRLGLFREDQPPESAANAPLRDLFLDRAGFDAWAHRYAQRLKLENSQPEERRSRMDAVNPWVVLRNHLAQQAIARAEQGDFSEVQRLHHVLQTPFTEQPEHASDAALPPDWAQAIEVSCSS